MKLHEYESKQLFAEHGVPIPPGKVVTTPHGARRVAEELGGPVAVKAQVLVGGRGKAGGIRVAQTAEDAERAAGIILGMKIKGLSVQVVLVEQAANIRQEMYLGVVVDRAASRVTLMASAEGGVEVEEVARVNPEAICRTTVEPLLGLRGYQTLALAKGIGLATQHHRAFGAIARGVYDAFCGSDASLAEINPLIVTAEGGLLALDGKVVLDDNALFRHPELALGREREGETSIERAAREAGLVYVELDGQIGCIVNGAGLAMATMDTIHHFGGLPANFLDIGGGARAETVATALRLILSDPKIKVVLLNIFGGITRCDEVAKGIVVALNEIQPSIPLVARLVGTNEFEGLEILASSGHKLTTAVTLADAARKAVIAADTVMGA